MAKGDPRSGAVRTSWGDLATIAKAAEAFDVDTSTVRRWVSRGYLAAYRLPSGALRVDLATLTLTEIRAAREA
ncbi:MAG: hypothetical protein FWD85_06945 [Microbacteriaceae bacterium]|nr:hypothetical protein [Microbacteriaceae bacterium]MCL2795027.1 hypothetical protein [Microbacteriaceae bacterium]